ncbi:uncharacterized protein APUU_22131S [Aspergillus puulaauensis]|uniref:Uncharacterized protein n=1 Tax=Aspergillus puulaauensis TaxID=1220207 RepID=A0A7R8AJF1_9EURO|nr:uncharacterized protein APUU_22131S [Aspergillus puulaauensis]BCS21699.1 hypothetical protein APUU_22131S [Aspergillus puulaauensis]
MSTHTQHQSLTARGQHLVARSFSQRSKAAAIFVTITGIAVVIYAICVVMNYRRWNREQRERREHQYLMRFGEAPPPPPRKASLASRLLCWKLQRPETRQDVLPLHNVGTMAMTAVPAPVAVNNGRHRCEECRDNIVVSDLPAYEPKRTGNVE